MHKGQKHVIAYVSKTLSKSQRCYCITYREHLALVLFVKYFRNCLWGRSFVVRADHSALNMVVIVLQGRGNACTLYFSFNHVCFFFHSRQGYES